MFQGEVYLRNLEKIELLREIANEKQAEISSIVLAWYLTQNAIDTVIPGAKKPEQVLRNIKTLEIELTTKEILGN